jgi:hypothetical protein
MSVKVLVAVAVSFAAAILHQASNVWERSYAKFISSEMSPDGCIRVDAYEPFWILPSFLHRIPDTDPSIRHGLGRLWEYPMFKRAYEVSTGAMLGETVVFNASSAHAYIFWNESKEPGRRIVEANGFPLADTSRCADEMTLAKLEAAEEKEREAKWAVHEAHQAEIREEAGNEMGRRDLP